LGLLFAALAQPTCNQAIMVAPPGSVITLFANPSFIPANGGVSVISALVIEPAGTPVPDGTVVQFFTSLGSIQEQGKTNDGVVRVNLVSDSRSGTATVTGVSGGPAAAPSASPSPSGFASVSAFPSSTESSASVNATSATSTVDVVIGSALPKTMIVTADPAGIRPDGPRESVISAFVLDERGNFVSNVPVIFTLAEGDPATERLEGEGQPRFTDNNGRAQDTLRTQYPVSAPAKNVVVRARAPVDLDETVTIKIN
jgi:hypothetical protein